MRNLILPLFIFLGFVANAQQTLDADVSTEFVHSKINELNLKIWNAVHSGEIAAYQNDSFATEKSSSEIREWSSEIISVKEIPHENGGIVSEVTTMPFDSIYGYSGARLNYDYSYSELGLNFDLRSYAPMFPPSTESGITLGEMPLFWVSTPSIKKVLDEREFEIISALIKQRMMLGDLMNPFWYPKNDTKLFGQSITFKTVFEDYFWNDFGSKEDTAIGSHLFSLLQFAALNYQQEKEVNIFYKNKRLTETYNYVPFDLPDTITINVPNPDNPGDPYDIIWREHEVYFQFDDITEVRIHRSKADYILELVNTKAKKNRVLFVKYSSLSQYLIENDRIVLESLLQEITK
jgi:hypothetical protein